MPVPEYLYIDCSTVGQLSLITMKYDTVEFVKVETLLGENSNIDMLKNFMFAKIYTKNGVKTSFISNVVKTSNNESRYRISFDIELVNLIKVPEVLVRILSVGTELAQIFNVPSDSEDVAEAIYKQNRLVHSDFSFARYRAHSYSRFTTEYMHYVVVYSSCEDMPVSTDYKQATTAVQKLIDKKSL